MNQRIQISLILLSLSFILVVLPGVGKYSFKVGQDELESKIFNDDLYLSVDQVAKYIVNEDSTIQIIDLRDEVEYNAFSIPGALNIPFESFYDRKPETWLHNGDIRYIFYSNDDLYSTNAMVIAYGLGYSNCYVMEGGLNAWFETIMNSSFEGERISARQNLVFETRRRAKDFFTEINSLPDSLKLKYAESRRQAERDLDGGCE